MNRVSKALALAGCVAILAACGGEDEDVQVQPYEPTPGAPELEGSGDYGVLPPQDDQERREGRPTESGQNGQQEASGQGDDAQMQTTEGQEIPPAPAVEFRD